MKEEAVLFGKTGSLVGIVSDPSDSDSGKNLPAVILLNSGLIHRVGPNRVYVKIARRLAAEGFVAFRFDFSGIGDSLVRYDNLSFEKSAVDEVQDAMDFLEQTRGIDRFLLLGICSGAINALNTAYEDSRVVGAAPINPPGEDERLSTYLRSRRYWKTVLLDPKRWIKPMVGKVSYALMVSNLKALFITKRKARHAAGDLTAGLQTLAQNGVDLLYIFSEDDPGLDYLDVVLDGSADTLNGSGKFRIKTIPHTDHTYTTMISQEHLLDIVQDWVQSVAEARLPEPVAS